MKKLLILTLSCTLLIPLYSCKKNTKVIEKNYDFQIQTIIGSVKIESKGIKRVPVIDEKLKVGETIVTDKKSIVDLLYGKRGLIRISENSKITISELNEKAGGNTQIKLEKGKAYVAISKLTRGTKFKVKTPTTVASIRGTSFRITAQDKSTRLDVISGKILLKPAQETKVIEDVEWEIKTRETININSETVKDVALNTEKADTIEIKKIAPEKMKEIKKEVKDIKAETLAKLHSATRTEFKINTLEMKKEEVEKEEKKIETFEFEDDMTKKENTTIKKTEENKKIGDNEKKSKTDEKKRKRLLAEKARLKAKAQKELEEKERAKKEQEEEKRLADEKAAKEQMRRKKEAEKKQKQINMPVSL